MKSVLSWLNCVTKLAIKHNTLVGGRTLLFIRKKREFAEIPLGKLKGNIGKTTILNLTLLVNFEISGLMLKRCWVRYVKTQIFQCLDNKGG